MTIPDDGYFDGGEPYSDDEMALIAMDELGLMKYWQVGSNNYPNAINARIEGDQLIVTYLQLDGFTKDVNYPLE